MRLDPALIKQQIGNLLISFPELAEDEVLRTDMVEGETEAFEFLTRLVRMIDDARALSDGTDQRLKDLQARRDRFDRRIEAYRGLAFKIMQAADLKKAELPEATLSIRTGTQKVVIVDEAAIPDFLCKTVRKPDMAKIKEELANNTSIAGAMLSNGEPSIIIRVK